jgi:glycosyltransferase XagB
MNATTTPRIGEILIHDYALTREQLESGLAEQRKTSTLLGTILCKKGWVTPLQFYTALARQHNLLFINLRETPPDTLLLNPALIDDYIKQGAIPIREYGAVTQVAVTDPGDRTTLRWVEQHYPNALLAVTTPRDVERTLQQVFARPLVQEAKLELWRRWPSASARRAINPFTRSFLWFCAATLSWLLVLFPQATLAMGLLLLNMFFITTLGFKLYLFLTGSWLRNNPDYHALNPLLPSDIALPVYSILVPLYREADSLPHLLNALRALDYPQDKLDIKLVLEADDDITRNALLMQKLEGMFDIITVPHAYPRTKPKACNYALRFCKGEYVTIYDAEDRPDPQQLRLAVATFRASPPNVVCLQARLNYYNRDQSLLTKLFAIEYACWFDYMLPALEYLDLPIPLGGTSNHFSLERLRKLGAWDAFNVTEDADLGIRAARRGGRTRVLPSLTLEEAPASLTAWLKQRARWIKGYMQTYLVQMRHPFALYRAMGLRRFLGFQFFIGGPCLVFLSTWPLVFIALASAFDWLALSHPVLILAYPLSLVALLTGLVLHAYVGSKTVQESGWQRMQKATLAFPFYWFLHAIASLRALFQLIVKPHYWDKTRHGHSREMRVLSPAR